MFPNNVRTTLGYDMADAQFTWKAVAELTGATFTGDVFGVSAADADSSLRFATTEWVQGSSGLQPAHRDRALLPDRQLQCGRRRE